MIKLDENGVWEEIPGFSLLLDPSVEFENRRTIQVLNERRQEILSELLTSDKEIIRFVEDILIFLESLGFKKNIHMQSLIAKRQQLREELSKGEK